ncbi:MAG: acyltransferase [Marinilabiliaceae bacterium]|nr:acyltransferase [Marinilabiliaceae bacterium]
MGFLSTEQLSLLGLKSFGENVLISDKASIYNPHLIRIGNNVRIDDFCILSGEIKLGSYIHISAYSALYGKFGIEMENFTGLSPRCTVFSGSDDFSGEFMISPMVPKELSNVTGGKVTLKRFAQIGAGSILLPNITIGEGTAVGAMSFVNKNTKDWVIVAGCPARFIKNRKKNILDLYESIQ